MFCRRTEIFYSSITNLTHTGALTQLKRAESLACFTAVLTSLSQTLNTKDTGVQFPLKISTDCGILAFCMQSTLPLSSDSVDDSEKLIVTGKWISCCITGAKQEEKGNRVLVNMGQANFLKKDFLF